MKVVIKLGEWFQIVEAEPETVRRGVIPLVITVPVSFAGFPEKTVQCPAARTFYARPYCAESPHPFLSCFEAEVPQGWCPLVLRI